MKTKLITVLTTVLFASSAHAWTPQSPPDKNIGTSLDSLLRPFKKTPADLGLPNNKCLVGLPNLDKSTPRVAKVAARMSAWIGEQTPDLKLPRVYLHREGDQNVFLVGPAENVLNMGLGDNQVIFQRETADGSEEGVLGIVDHTNEVHYIHLTNLSNIGAEIEEYKDSEPLDGHRLGRMIFRVKTARPTKQLFGGIDKNFDSYTVTALYIRLGGALRVFGLCM